MAVMIEATTKPKPYRVILMGTKADFYAKTEAWMQKHFADCPEEWRISEGDRQAAINVTETLLLNIYKKIKSKDEPEGLIDAYFGEHPTEKIEFLLHGSGYEEYSEALKNAHGLHQGLSATWNQIPPRRLS